MTATHENSASRRAILGALIVAPAAAIAAPAALDGLTGGAVSPAFARKIAAYHAADEAEAAFDEQVYTPAVLAYHREADRVSHTACGPDPYSGRLTPVTTADTTAVRDARRLVHDVASGKCWLETETYPSLGEHFVFCQRLAAAADRRDAQLKRLQERLGLPELQRRCDRLATVRGDAFRAIVAAVPANAADMVAKLELVDACGAHEDSDVWAAILRDGRALAEIV